MRALEQATSAAVGGAIATTVLYPLDALRTKMASSTRPDETALKTVARVVKSQGVSGLFGGLPPKVMQSVLGKFLYFLWYTTLTAKLALIRGRPLQTYELLLCGYFAEALHLPFTIPLEVVTTQMQKDDKADGIGSVLSRVWNEGGLWRGWKVYAYLCTQPAIQFVLFERLKLLSPGPVSSGRAFMFGALARAVAVLITFPFTRARTIIQSRAATKNGEKKKPDISVFQLLVSLVSDQGFLSLYRGFQPELIRGVLSSALMLMIKERVNFKFA